MEEIFTMEDYFTYINHTLGESFVQKYPILSAYYQSLKTACLALNQQPQNNLFDSLKKLLYLDAQLQILMEYHKMTKSNFHKIFSEQELIDQIKKDSHTFYRELVGLNTVSKIPIGIIYLGDCNKVS